MEENNTKEINLLQLIGSVIAWFAMIGKKLLTFAGKMIKLSYKYKIVTLVIIAIFIAIGQYESRPSARVYSAEAMAMLYGPNSRTVKEVCKQLENTLSTNRLVSLSTKLGLPDTVAKNIVSINSYYVVDYLKDGTPDKVDFGNNHALTDTLNLIMGDRLYFQIKTHNIRQVPQVQAAILNYFDKNQVLNTEYQMGKNNLISKIKICDVELKRIDSLAKVSYFKDMNQQISFDNNKLTVGEPRKQLFYNELLSLQSVKSSSETYLADYKRPVELPSDLVVNPNPLNSRTKYGVYSIFIGYLLALLLVGLIDNFKTIKSFLDK